jgi:thiol-disulfide isomerase/thioredoxin
MKKILLLLLFTVFISKNLNATQWMTSYEDARKIAIATNKFILVDFWATWCGPCLKMDLESWSKEDVQLVMNNFVPLKIDIDVERSLSSKFNIRSIPHVFILDPNGEVVNEQKSYINKQKVLNFLEKYSYNTPMLQPSFAGFYKNNEGDMSLEIAEKYLDFSLYVKDDVKNNFISLADKYLSITSKLYKKEWSKSKNSQRIGMLEDIYINVLKGKYEKSLGKLDKDFIEEKIEESNKKLYTYLKFIIYYKLDKNEQSKIWYEKLKLFDGYKDLLAKSRKV